MIAVNDLIITSIETITAFELVTGDYLFTLDEIQNASVAQGQETTEITGKQGRRLGTLKRNKTATISGTNGLISGGLLEMQTGAEWVKNETTVMWHDDVAVASNKAKIRYKAVGTTGNEIAKVYVKDETGLVIKELTQHADTVSETQFTYDADNKELTFNTSVADGTEIAVYYTRKINAGHLDNYSDKYSGKCELYIDAMCEDKCGNIYHAQFYFPKADFSGEFTIDMGGDQAVHAFEAEALSGACGTGGMFWSLTVFGEDEKDVEDP